MKIAICEDSKQDLSLFIELCNMYNNKHNTHVEVFSFCSSVEFLKDYYPKKYDALFLDIYMKDLTGIDIAKEIRKLDEDVKIIFTTTSTQHYSHGFAVEATHYLIKPLTTEKFEQAMHRLRNFFDQSESLLVLLNGSKLIEIPQNTIIYIETIRNGIEVHCKHEIFPIRTPLSKAIKQLDEKYFLQCHRYSIVNLKEVCSISGDSFLMSDGKQILIRKANQKQIEQVYHKYRVSQLRGGLK